MQLDPSWSHLETPQTHRKSPNLTGKCLNPKVAIQASSRCETGGKPSTRFPPGQLVEHFLFIETFFVRPESYDVDNILLL